MFPKQEVGDWGVVVLVGGPGKGGGGEKVRGL